MAWIDLNGPVLADTVYDAGKLVAKDVTITLPAINLLTADFKAMGTLTLPIIGQIEAMEATVNKVGTDMGLRSMASLDSRTLEFRWVQDVVKSDGTVKPEGCKAFVRAIPLSTPELEVELGNATEAETTYTVTRQQIYCNGEEYLCVDRLSGVLRVAGTDYYTDISSLL